MSCVRCHREIAADAAYCPACGASQQGEANAVRTTRRLVRIPTDAKLAGVCAGIADYLDVDVTMIRALWLALSIVPGAIVGGMVAYALAWVVMPVGQATRTVRDRRLVRSATDARIAGVCAGLADYFDVDATPVRVLWIVLSVLPGAVVGGLLAYLAAWLIVPKAPVAVMKPSETRAA
jgi:phage shock protein PspC (stress-responsive transcriptional regulator)